MTVHVTGRSKVVVSSLLLISISIGEVKLNILSFCYGADRSNKTIHSNQTLAFSTCPPAAVYGHCGSDHVDEKYVPVRTLLPDLSSLHLGTSSRNYIPQLECHSAPAPNERYHQRTLVFLSVVICCQKLASTVVM
jgi:hypothetical protein